MVDTFDEMFKMEIVSKSGTSGMRLDHLDVSVEKHNMIISSGCVCRKTQHDHINRMCLSKKHNMRFMIHRRRQLVPFFWMISISNM